MALDELKPEPTAPDTSALATALQDTPATPTVDTPATKPPTGIRESLKAGFDADKRGEMPTRLSPKQLAAMQRAREEGTGKFAPGGSKDTADTDKAAMDAPDKAATADKSSPTDAKVAPAPVVSTTTEQPPTSWSKEAKDAWPTLPAATQQAIVKREREIADGSTQHQQLKARYDGIDAVLQPVRPMLQQMGKSDADAIRQLFAWQYELSGPRKLDAIKALAQSHGIDLSQLNRPNAPTDPNLHQTEQSLLAPHLQPILSTVQTLEQRLAAIQASNQREAADRVQSELTNFAKDKPHFNAVRVMMGQLIQSGAATDLNDAYDKATWANPEIRAAIQAEAETKRQTEAKAAADKVKSDADAAEAERKRKAAEQATNARRASVSIRGGTPAGNAANPKAQHKSVRETLVDSIKENRV